MPTIDTSRDEVRLAGVLEQLTGRWRVVHTNTVLEGPPSLVDVAATNEALLLSGWRLDDFVGISPDDLRVPRVENLLPASRPIKPQQIAVILLCGGVGSRSGGQIYPLLQVEDKKTLSTRTLLNLQLDRLAHSPLARAKSLVLGSLLNEVALRQHLKKLPSVRQPRLYLGGLVPRLALSQMPSDSPLLFHDPSGQPSYNPTGHLDSLRWLVVSGTLAELHEIEVLLIASYSNWGRIFTTDTLDLAAYVAEQGYRESGPLLVVEVVSRPRDKRTGSMLATRVDTFHELRLVKYGYGQGIPCLPKTDTVLMSTNTLYVSVAALRQRLCRAAPSIGLPECQQDLTRLLQEAAMGQRRNEACLLFDAAFPVGPLLTCKRTAGGTEVLQVERDIDQLSLLPVSVGLQAVKVGEERAVSIKLPEDLQDPAKHTALFGN